MMLLESIISNPRSYITQELAGNSFRPYPRSCGLEMYESIWDAREASGSLG